MNKLIIIYVYCGTTFGIYICTTYVYKKIIYYLFFYLFYVPFIFYMLGVRFCMSVYLKFDCHVKRQISSEVLAFLDTSHDLVDSKPSIKYTQFLQQRSRSIL